MEKKNKTKQTKQKKCSIRCVYSYEMCAVEQGQAILQGQPTCTRLVRGWTGLNQSRSLPDVWWGRWTVGMVRTHSVATSPKFGGRPTSNYREIGKTWWLAPPMVTAHPTKTDKNAFSKSPHDRIDQHPTQIIKHTTHTHMLSNFCFNIMQLGRVSTKTIFTWFDVLVWPLDNDKINANVKTPQNASVNNSHLHKTK